MGREVGGRFEREETDVYLWLIHVDVWQKPTQYCKAIILHLKINLIIQKNKPQGEAMASSWLHKELLREPELGLPP